VEEAPTAWMHFAACGILGMVTSYVFIASTQYYTGKREEEGDGQ